ncbi:MAG: helix-turn-helix domain-containing protein [Desulfatitalea sp.]|nr:helix-turn-helix domain-containing protein [Desulfatitalea sp.]
MRDKNHIQSLERGLRLLEMVGEASPPPSLTEIARQMDLNKTTTQRFLQTLCTLGYLNRTENKRFVWGHRVLRLGYKYLDNANLVQVAQSFIDAFSAEVTGTINLAVLEQSEVVFIYRKEVRRFLNFDLHAGSRLPAHCTASGKALLSDLEDPKLREILAQMELERVTSRTLTSKQALWDDLMQTRQRGYSICDRELSMDLISMGVLLYEHSGKALAAMNLSLNAKDCDDGHLKLSAAQLMQTGKAISRALGYRGNYPRQRSAFDNQNAAGHTG